jgi:hypothetical protein
VCCPTFAFCENESQCCGPQDVTSCLPDSNGVKRCCSNEDESCANGPGGRYHCCPGLSCIRDIFGNDYCRD